MRNKRIRKSTLMLLGFTLYSVAMYAYLIPRANMSLDKICLTVGTNVVVIIALWLLYRKKEKMSGKYNDVDNKKD